MKKTIKSNFLRFAIPAIAVVLILSNLGIESASATSTTKDLSVTQATDLISNNTIGSTPFNLIFTITNTSESSSFSINTIIFSSALAPKATFGPITIKKSDGVTGDIECKINGIFRKSLDCKAKSIVTMPAGSNTTITLKVTPTTLGTFVNPRATSKTHCKVDYTSSINGDVLETNESNNDCTPQSLSINVVGSIAPSSNLILNSSVETSDPNNSSLPENWASSVWGTNDTSFTYPTPGQEGQKAVQININSYVDGDARWEFKEIEVKPLEIYRYSDWYKSDTTTYPIVRFTNDDGSYYYFALRPAEPSTDWKQYSESFRVPFTAKSMLISHTVRSSGFLSLDNFSLIKLPKITP